MAWNGVNRHTIESRLYITTIVREQRYVGYSDCGTKMKSPRLSWPAMWMGS